MTKGLWPRLTYPAPDDAIEHLAALSKDFRSIYDHVQSGPGRMIQPAMFDQLYQSFQELSRKLKTQLQYRPAATPRRSHRLRLAQCTPTQDVPDNEVGLRTHSTKSKSQEKLSTGSSNGGNCFTIPVKDKRTVRLVQSLPQEQLRRLICQASHTDPDITTAPGGQKLASLVTQHETGDIEVHCSTKEEGRAFTKHKKWLHGFEKFVGAEVPVYAVRINDIPVKNWNRHKKKPHDVLAKQLARLNIEPITTLQSPVGVIGVVWTKRAPENQVTQVLIEFSKPEIANEAIAKGVIWVDKEAHKCIREVQDYEVPECTNCHGFSCKDECRNDTHCGNCFAPHSTNECAIDTAHCVLCDKLHRLSGTLCQRKSADLERAKDSVRLRQPLFPVLAATASSSSTSAQPAIPEVNGSVTSNVRPPVAGLNEMRRSESQDNSRNATKTASSSRREDEHTIRAIPTQPRNPNVRQRNTTTNAHEAPPTAMPTVPSNPAPSSRPQPTVNPGTEASRKRKEPGFASAAETERETARSKRHQTSRPHHDDIVEDSTHPSRRMIQQHGTYIERGESPQARDPDAILAHRPEWRRTGANHYGWRLDPDRYYRPLEDRPHYGSSVLDQYHPTEYGPDPRSHHHDTEWQYRDRGYDFHPDDRR